MWTFINIPAILMDPDLVKPALIKLLAFIGL